MEDSSRSRNHPGLPCGEEIFLGASQLLPECCKISREGRSSGVWFQEGIVQTVMQAIKRERVCAQDEMGFELLESLCTLLQGERLLGTPHVSRVFSGLLMTTAPVTQQLRLLMPSLPINPIIQSPLIPQIDPSDPFHPAHPFPFSQQTVGKGRCWTGCRLRLPPFRIPALSATWRREAIKLLTARLPSKAWE